VTRYLVEQTFTEPLAIPAGPDGAQLCQSMIANNNLDGVTWIHSYITADKRKGFYICDAPTPEAVRRAAQRNGLPVDRILEVRVLDPYFYL
jgi:hypothetical protein